jgi:taurine--2-oxoglutarate transaminase
MGDKSLDNDAMDIIERYLYGTWMLQKKWSPQLLISDGEGAYLIDKDGKKYLDFSSQLVCVNLGYKNRELIKALHKQIDKIAYVGPALGLEIRAEAAKAFASIAPKNLIKFVFSSSGTEANEDALKIARLYKNPCYKIIARYRSYHGSTATSMSLTGDLRRTVVEYHTNVRGTVFAPDPYCYRCPFNLEYPKCGVACAEYLEYMIEREKNVAAIFMEPITGTNGVIVPPPEYYKIIREIADKYGVLLIFDEVMSGWGRTGEWFAHQRWGVEADIMTTAKGASSSYVPIGITATTKAISDYFEDHFFAVGHTFAYHPLAMAALTAVIRVMKEHNYVYHAKRLGGYIRKRLFELMSKHPSIGDIRGVGLFWAVELVKNRNRKTPFNTDEDKILGRPLVTGEVASRMRELGVLVMYWITHLVIAPPLIVDTDDIDRGIDALDEALKVADEKVEK